jgi:hypothetical protein
VSVEKMVVQRIRAGKDLAVAGVYLVLAQTSGKQYVGSAYGPSGIWERWRKYAISGDGGNVQLRESHRTVGLSAVSPEKVKRPFSFACCPFCAPSQIWGFR